ncbi:MAG: phosphoribosylanthranilate isomerase [Candidatus Omnitrophica bacterium]|nr:phosphoribosylanthranilate isomerase [Candidatus Omnitrophota bacterium]
MVKIKFCGLKRPEEVRWAEELKADFIGFNLYPKSPRCVSPAKLKKLAGEVKTARKVLVFVNSTLAEIVRAATESGADIIQLHGDETPRFCSRVMVKTGRPVIKAFRLANEKDLKPLEEYLDSADYFLLDARTKDLYGGTGRLFPWNLAVKAKILEKPIFLAGGLTAENVTAACRQIMPFAVDVSGGIEEKTGVKSREMMTLFAQKVRISGIL